MAHHKPSYLPLIVAAVFIAVRAVEYPCDSNIYCRGPLLESVQLARIFPDDKTFVDMHLLENATVVFDEFMKMYDSWPTTTNYTKNISTSELSAFVGRYFDGPGAELEPCAPADWTAAPSVVNHVRDHSLKDFALAINAIWSQLGVRVHANVSAAPDRYSFLPVPNPVVIPGGRFREFYYWDSFWIVKGLLLCDMFTTARGMIENLGTMIDRFGFVPNGGRVYYTRRSQPPMLTLMLGDYYNTTKDDAFVKEMLPRLEREHAFFMANRSVAVEQHGKTYHLNQFRAPTTYPRPESFIEDYEAAKGMDQEESETLYQNIASAAESGADFSTRWFKDPTHFAKGTRDIDILDIVEVDLNAIMCKVEKQLADLFDEIGDSDKADLYRGYAKTRSAAFSELFWNGDDGIWQDWSLSGQSHRTNFYASYVSPWWADCHGDIQGSILPDTEISVMGYLASSGVTSFPGGVPTSLVNSGQQWDLPNVWAPLQYFFVEALSMGQWEETRQLAQTMATRWVATTYLAYSNPKYNIFFEKYDAYKVGIPGGGGEYTYQTGFGWTNGMALYALRKYGAVLSTQDLYPAAPGAATDSKDDGGAPTAAEGDKDTSLWVVAGFSLFMALICILVRCCLNKGKNRASLTPQEETYGAI